MSVAGVCPVPPLISPQANRFAPELLAAAECMRQLAVRQPGRVFAVPYLSSFCGDDTVCYSARVLEFQVDPLEWINYHDILILHAGREDAEREVRRRKPLGADGILQLEGVLG